MAHSDPIREFYGACNRTELYQLCTRVGLVVSPAMPREKLVSYLVGDEVPPPLEHPISVWRNGLIGLIQDYWTGIEAQLKCPAKELGPPAQEGDPPKPDPSDHKSPLACYRCVDTRVVSCLIDNEKHEGLIQLHRKMTVPPRKDSDDMTTTISTLTLETAPRTLEGMNAGDGVGRGPLKRLYTQLVNDGAAPGDERSMVAYVDADTSKQRELVVQYLQVWDQMKGRTTGAASVVVTNAPAPTPVVGGAAAATPAPATEPKRTPSNRGKRTEVPVAAEAAPTGDSASAPPTNVGEAIVQQLEAIRIGLGGIKLALDADAAQGQKLERMILSSDEMAATRNRDIMQAITGLDRTIKVSMAITLWQIENQMETPPSEVLAQAGTYITILERALAGGKAS